MDSSAAIIISTLLADFFAKHSAKVLLPTAKILNALLSNASSKEEEKYRKVRLSNPKIQASIVQVADALDVLAVAGFVMIENNDFLVYAPPNGSHEIARAICHQLETKIRELENTKKPRVSKKTDSSPFLSGEERKKRIEKAKAARKAQQAQRLAEQRRWEEHKQERLEAAKLKEQAAARTTTNAPVLAVGVTVKELATGRRRKVADAKQAEKTCSPPKASATDASEQDSLSNNKMDVSLEESDTAASVAKAPNDDKEDESKPSVSIMPPRDIQADELWQTCTADLSTCQAANGIRDTSYFKMKNHPSDSLPVTCLKRLYQELRELSESLPNERLASIWIRFDEEMPQYLRALMTAPLGTPYAGGLFCFDIFVPNDYPHGPPTVVLLTTGGGRVRFGPNLYADGKVCLSLLGTWSGPKWSPSHSNLYQVLVSIQGLILGAEQPWFLEPGHGGWEGDVKEGDYVKQGQTLTGAVVRAEVGVPPHVQKYNNVLRVGTVRFAMLETLSGSHRHLKMFELPIRYHFFCNRSAILREVRSWPVDISQENNMDVDEKQGMPFSGMRSSPSGSLKDLLPQLEVKFSTLGDPSSKDDVVGHEGCDAKKTLAVPANDTKLAPAKKSKSEQDLMQVDSVAEATAPAALQHTSAGSSSSSKTDALRSRMQEAASSGNFILAGQLQEQLNQLDDLERRIQKAASEGNFIRAGRLQEQMEALMNTDDNAPTGSAMYAYDESAQNEDSDDMMDDDIPPPPMGGGMGHHQPTSIGGFAVGKDVFVPPGHASTYRDGNHSWGSGTALNPTTKTAAASATVSLSEGTASNAAIKMAPPPASVCHLRFRLPESKTCLEDFDRNDPLSSVYSRLESIMSAEQQSEQGPRALGSGSQQHDVAPPLRTSGAWAQPQSLPGFTLLLSHPKREFSLEMHGTKTLTELGLVPSATLTVMKCADRGLAFRGELESRLTAAQGNAMDVEGLSYEGLLELTERVGSAKPTAITQETLDSNSTLLSPSNLEINEQEGVGHCPICLGEFDRTNTDETLRQLHKCGHTFHAACLATWLGTKSSCPMCKSSIADS